MKDAAVLETGCVYIVPLMESLRLPQDLAAAANPKSSTGRLDVFTRVITDRAREFDMVPAGYEGPLYLEVSPRTFPVLVRSGSRLSQMRFRRGEAKLDDKALLALHRKQGLVDGVPHISSGITLTIDLGGMDNGIVGFRAKRHTGVIDVDKRAMYEAADFWEPIPRHWSSELVLDPDQFYILVSREAVHVYRPSLPPKWYLSIPWSASFGSTTPASSTPVLAIPKRVERGAARCWKCAATRSRSSSNTARPSAASSTRS